MKTRKKASGWTNGWWVKKEVVCDDVREGSRSQMKQGMQATVTSSEALVQFKLSFDEKKMDFRSANSFV